MYCVQTLENVWIYYVCILHCMQWYIANIVLFADVNSICYWSDADIEESQFSNTALIQSFSLSNSVEPIIAM